MSISASKTARERGSSPSAKRIAPVIEYRSLVNREARYRRGGLTRWERQDLMRRYDLLSARVRYNKHDRQRRAPKWQRRR